MKTQMNNMLNNAKQRKSIRLKNYDYSQSGFYYVTICSQNRKCIFGQVVNGKMIRKWWNKIPERFNRVKLDIFQIMPNHIHTIIHIVGVNPTNNGSDNPTPTRGTTLGQIIAYFKYQSTKQINNSVGGGVIPPNHGVIPPNHENISTQLLRTHHPQRNRFKQNPSIHKNKSQNLG